MRRRSFFGLIGIATAWPLVGRADDVRRIAVLMSYSENDPAGQARFKSFARSLQKLGWVEGRNTNIESRWPGADVERAQRVAKELVAWQPDVIVTTSTPLTAAVKRETATIPIVFTNVSDPIGEGFVASLASPGGNMTGFINYESSIAGKWIELLKQIDNRITRAAILFNPDVAPRGGSYFLPPFEAAAKSLAIAPLATPVRTEADIETAISVLAREPGAGVVMSSDSFMGAQRARVVEHTIRYGLPSVYPFRSAAAEGGLLAYGPDISEFFNPVIGYVDRILRGTRPNELPVQVPTKIELVVNLRTAKAIGLTVPPWLLARADEVIE